MEERLPGGNAGGAVLVDGTVRRATGPWTPAVHALLDHLEARGFEGAPRALGIDERGREILTYLPGETVGTRTPWPAWVHSDSALVDAGRWLRGYHEAVAGFVPPADARWRLDHHAWRPGDVLGHNDAAPFNAVWDDGGLVGFVDWDFAAPCPAIWDLAWLAFSWVPLHARDVGTAEGFTAFDERPARLRLLMSAYDYAGTTSALLEAVRDRTLAHVEDVRALAAAGVGLFGQLVDAGHPERLLRAVTELEDDRSLWRP